MRAFILLEEKGVFYIYFSHTPDYAHSTTFKSNQDVLSKNQEEEESSHRDAFETL